MQGKQTVWVTGGAGYIGSFVCAQLLAKGIRPVVIDDLSTGHLAAVKDLIVTRWDVSKDNLYERVFYAPLVKDFGVPQAIIHLAAKTCVPIGELEKQTYHKNNVIGTYNVARLAEVVGCKNLVFASSAAVYGDLGRRFADVRLKNLKPLNHYGRTKLQAEELLRDLFPGLNVSILRFFNVAGAHMNFGQRNTEPKAIIPTMVRAFLKNEPVALTRKRGLFKDSFPVRDFIHVKDVAYMVVWRALNPTSSSRLYVENVGRGAPVGLGELAREFEFCTQMLLKTVYRNVLSHDVMTSVARLQEPWAYKKFTSLQRILLSELEWQKSSFFNG